MELSLNWGSNLSIPSPESVLVDMMLYWLSSVNRRKETRKEEPKIAWRRLDLVEYGPQKRVNRKMGDICLGNEKENIFLSF